ncbi:hypothetical protein [Limoniibacter endophyticus]|uniref:Hpt domain-containing protein n=1 Tax=Limoniibacter endophyticus TaxID=1565040 RepID=A0A8J3DFK4_9HYPH|nr:hypothetical protein [Limoniibacter endophyticus]GHC60470.1 hypothetical protein GCM10010136_00510 [Limoniibacter endophyticus]
MAQQIPYAANDDAPPIDLDFLRRQTLGNGVLQQELLSMFRDQIAETQEHLAHGLPAGHREILHALRGAALNLGAFLLAEKLRELDESETGSYQDLECMLDRMLQFLEQRFG